MTQSSAYSRKLKYRVLLVGYDPEGKCVYNAFISVHEYYDGEHPWDDGAQVKTLRLQTVHGYIFGKDGKLEQEFESHFDINTGLYKKGWSKDEDGVLSEV